MTVRLPSQDMLHELIAAGADVAGVPRGNDGELLVDLVVSDEQLGALTARGAAAVRVLSARLDELLPADRVVAIDSGNFMGYPSGYLSVPDEYGFCFTQAFQSIGLGLATQRSDRKSVV